MKQLSFTIYKEPNGFNFLYHMNECFEFKEGDYKFVEAKAVVEELEAAHRELAYCSMNGNKDMWRIKTALDRIDKFLEQVKC